MCIGLSLCILKKQIKKKNSLGGCANPPNVPKLGISGVKDTAKTKNYFQKYFYNNNIFFVSIF